MKQDTNTVADARDLAFAQHVWKELKTLPIILPDNFTTVGEAYAKLQEFIFDRDIDREKQDRICDAFDKFEVDNGATSRLDPYNLSEDYVSTVTSENGNRFWVPLQVLQSIRLDLLCGLAPP